MKKFLALLLLSVFYFQFSSAQAPPKPRKSPLAVASLKCQKTYIKVVYSQPFKNDREIFGGLVPYNKVWRTGANEATEFTVTQKVKFGGKVLQPGTYSLLTIPGEKNWTIILNCSLGMWGDYEYNADQDALRVEVPVSTLDTSWEAFTIKLENNGNMANMSMIWDKTAAVIPIEILK